MAYHCLLLKNKDEFYTKLKYHDPDLVVKLVTCVINAHKRKLTNVDVFDITFKNSTELLFNVAKEQYKDLLKTYIPTLEKLEEYELCSDIIKIVEKKSKKEHA